MEIRDSAHATPLSYQSSFLQKKDQRLCDIALVLVDRYRGWLFAALLGIYFLSFNGQWRIERDSALYLTIGRNLAEGHGYSYHDQPNHLVFPGLPLVLAGTFCLSHGQNTLPALIVMFIMGWAVLGLTYRLFFLYAGRPTAVVMTVGLGMTRLFYRYCFELLSDLPFLLGVMAFLAGYEAIFSRQLDRGDIADADVKPAARSRWYDWALLIAGLGFAISMRPVFWVLLPAVALDLVWRAIRGEFKRLHIVIAVGAVVAVLLFYKVIDPRRHVAAPTGVVEDYEGTVISKLTHLAPLLKEELPDSIRQLLPGAALVKALFGCSLNGLNTLLGLLVLALGLSLFRRRVLWGFLVIFTIGMLLIFKPLDRYFLAVIPLLVFAWWEMLIWLNRRLPLKWGNLVFIGLFLGGLGTNIARIGEMVVEQRRQPFLAHYRDGRYRSLKHVVQFLQANTDPHEWILVGRNKGRILTFVAHRNVFEPTKVEKLHPDHPLYVLTGPSWEESREGREGRVITIREWLDAYGLERAAVPIKTFQDSHDGEPWALYQVLPKK